MRAAAAALAAALGLAGAAAGIAAATPAPVDPAAAALGFVDVHSAVPDAILDLRYATANNFVHRQLYPAGARCLIHESLAPGLTRAADALRSRGYTLVFWDCYRPHRVQVAMFDAVPDPTFVARPGDFSRSHETGRSVDVTFADAARRLADTGTDFDDFSARAGAYTTAGLTPTQVAARALLREAMTAGGLAAYTGEWWHFDGAGAGVHRPIVDVPLT